MKCEKEFRPETIFKDAQDLGINSLYVGLENGELGIRADFSINISTKSNTVEDDIVSRIEKSLIGQQRIHMTYKTILKVGTGEQVTLGFEDPEEVTILVNHENENVSLVINLPINQSSKDNYKGLDWCKIEGLFLKEES